MSTSIPSKKHLPIIGHPSLPDEIARWMIENIRSGVWSPGDRLPSERHMCEQFGISRTVMREALSRLKADGLLKVQQGRGAFVAERAQWQSFQLNAERFHEKEGQAQVIELLAVIEAAAARLAAKRRTEDELKVIRRALFGMEYAISQGRLGDEEDYSFHKAIAEATHNPHFRDLNEYLEHRVRRLIRQARSNTASRYQERIKAVQDEHHAIFDAIVAGDAEAAGAAAESHLRKASERLDIYRDEERQAHKTRR